MAKLLVSIIIPCYNEQEVIRETGKRIVELMDGHKEYNFEVLFINDGSKDKTLPILEELAAEESRFRVVSMSRNFGHQPGVSAGIRNCSGDVAAIIDADLQDPPHLIPEMVKKMQEEGASVVYGVRAERKGESAFKKATAGMFYRLLNSMSEIKIPLDTGDFRVIDRRVIDEFKKLTERNKYIRGLISWIGFKQIAFPYVREARFAGETKYPLRKMLRFATNGVLYFTKKPLQTAITLGMISIFLGLLFSIYVFVSRFVFQGSAVPGWASTLIIIIFFGGVQLLTIGVMGEYIGSIFDEIKGRPEFIVDKKINFPKEK